MKYKIVESRFDERAVNWAKRIKYRDNYCCVVCGAENKKKLESHHLDAWASYPELRIDIQNGVSLCTTCHNQYHSMFGKGENTRYQFYEFVRIYNLLKKIAKQELGMEDES